MLASLFSMGTGQGGFAPSSSATSSLSDRSPVNIAPVGVNFGAIMQPYGQGSPENGGLGGDYMARYAGGAASRLTPSNFGASNWLPYVLAGGAGLVALLFFMR